MLLENDGPLSVASAWSRGTRSGILLVPAALFLLKKLHGSVAGLVVAAVACQPQLTGATGRCPLHIPFGHQRHAGQPVAAARRSEQAGRMSRNRQEQRSGGGAGRTRR
jgi:hypothetical protein